MLEDIKVMWVTTVIDNYRWGSGDGRSGVIPLEEILNLSALVASVVLSLLVERRLDV